MIDEELERLCYRADDLIRRSILTDAHFLNAKEQYFLGEYLNRCGHGGRYIFFGGYPEAERKMLLLLPDYVYDMTEGMEGDREAFVRSVLAEEIESVVQVIKITGSGYRTLSHRDYMGAILGLGIERFVVGDIVLCEEDNSALVFCEKKMSEYIISELTEVGPEKVKTIRFDLPEDFSVKRNFQTVSDTVASERFDCVVASLASCSRERAKEIIICGEAEKNYTAVKKTDSEVCSGDIITIRGKGKFVIRSISDMTKKGRIKLIADKYL